MVLNHEAFSHAKLQARFFGWVAAKIAYRDGESDRPARSHIPSSQGPPKLSLAAHDMASRVSNECRVQK
eukprot:6235460-Pyramimonas_sp.AAC.1